MAKVPRNSAQRDRNRRAIARTKPACHICGKPIDYTLTNLPDEHGQRCKGNGCKGCVPHPDRFEADHVIPLAKGGSDTLDNMRAAHRRCNSTKRARLVAPIIRRSGALNR